MSDAVANAALRAEAPSRSARIGAAAEIGTVLIWAGWIVATRHAVKESLDPAAIALLRFAVPSLAFAPVWWRMGLWPKAMTWPFALALLGSGAPFTFIVATAMRNAPSAEVGPLLPAAMPLIVALLSAFAFKERLGFERWIGAAFIAFGILATLRQDLFGLAAGWRAHALLIGAAGAYAVFTVAFKRGALSALEATAIVALWSALAAVPFGAVPLIEAWRAGIASSILAQAFLQGVLSGVFAILLYGVSVKRLGASRAAGLVALVPALAALLAIPVDGEWPSGAAWASIAASTLGVLLLSGVRQILFARGG